MKRHILGFTILALLLLLSGCVAEEELTPKQMITKQLVKEINSCHNKFTADSQAFMYCEKLLDMTNRLIDEGFFDDSEIETIYESEKKLNITDNEVEEEFESFKTDIFGDI